jgi:hypothetical protein
MSTSRFPLRCACLLSSVISCTPDIFFPPQSHPQCKLRTCALAGCSGVARCGVRDRLGERDIYRAGSEGGRRSTCGF